MFNSDPEDADAYQFLLNSLKRQNSSLQQVRQYFGKYMLVLHGPKLYGPHAQEDLFLIVQEAAYNLAGVPLVDGDLRDIFRMGQSTHRTTYLCFFLHFCPFFTTYNNNNYISNSQWYNKTINIKSLKGGGPQGSTIGILDAGVPVTV